MRGLVGHVVETTGLDIVSGRYPADHVMPTEAVWAAQVGVSRTVLREACKVLISKGLLSSGPRVGTRVRGAEHWKILDPDVLRWRMQAAPREAFVAELFELRRIVEPAIAARAAVTAGPRDLVAIEAAYAAMEAASGDPERFINPDTAFHKAILRSVDNLMVRALADVVDAALTVSLQLSLDNPNGHAASLPLHAAVLEAIRGRDPAAAASAMTRLIEDAQKDSMAALSAGRERSR
jgi:DNA-binding FadR family transcriptional regulator